MLAKKNKKLYVLVEGNTDKEILDFCIAHIDSDSSSKINIIPFDNPKRNGGVPSICDFIKTLLNANNSGNRYLALLDNDTEGVKIKDLLIKTKVKNVFIRTYPDLKDFKKYPTFKTMKKGGIANDNINGRAASIETYLPDDLLTNDFGALFPIRWMTYIKEVSKYQGSFDSKIKDLVLERFRNFKSQVQKDNTLFYMYNWTKIEGIIDIIKNSIEV